MAKAKSEFRKYVDTAQSLPQDVVLGNLVWLTVTDGAYNLDEITKSFAELELNNTFVPQPTSAFNAFEKACSKALQGAKPYQLDKGQMGEIMAVRESHKDEQRVVRQVIREIRDSRANKLRHEPVAELVLYRPQPGKDSRIDRTHPPRTRPSVFKDRLFPDEADHITTVIEKWNSEFDRLYNYIDGDKVRAIVRNYLGFMNAVMMKSGVYFVHKNREAELLKLEAFVQTLPGCQLVTMQIPEIKKLRESVIEAFQEEAVKELNEVVAAIQKVRESRQTITTSALIKLNEQYKQVMDKATEYTRTLRCSQDRTAGAAEIASECLEALREDMVAQEVGA